RMKTMATGGGGYPRHGRTTRPKADLPFAATETEHPLPPSELNEEEAEIWRGFVNRMPGDYFPSPTWPMLVQLCRHVRNSRLFARQLRVLEEKLPHTIDEQRAQLLRSMMAISRAQANESRIITLLSTRLKLTRLYDSAAVHKARRSFLTEQRPWDVPTDEDLPH